MEFVQGKNIPEVRLVEDVQEFDKAIFVITAHGDHLLHAWDLQRLSIELVQLRVDEALKGVLQNFLRPL